MKRARSRSRVEKDASLLTKIQAIKADHPLWGYRRVWAYLRYRNGLVVGNNTICRIMKENGLLVQKTRPYVQNALSRDQNPAQKSPINTGEQI